MPDLTLERFFHCSTAEGWQTEVPSSSGNDTYLVRWSKDHLNRDEVQYDYSCTCWSYRKGKGKYCKHIEAVRRSGQHCKWMQFTDGDEPVVHDNEHFCPKCGRPAYSMLWGV